MRRKKKPICEKGRNRQKPCWARVFRACSLTDAIRKSKWISDLEGHHQKVTEVRCGGNQDGLISLTCHAT